MGSLKETLGSKETRDALAAKGALKGELNQDVRTVDAELQEALKSAVEAETSPDLAGLAVEELRG